MKTSIHKTKFVNHCERDSMFEMRRPRSWLTVIIKDLTTLIPGVQAKFLTLLSRLQPNHPLFVTVWKSLSCFCLCLCIFIIFHQLPSLVYHLYYLSPDSASSCTRVPQSRLCVSVWSEPESVSRHSLVISGFLPISRQLCSHLRIHGISRCYD